ncbi:MAG: sugar ABC transporter permease [Propionibacteriaceae bacterium]|jgi:xylobiose transport system permease protein|nr:sugar ABC transporter permease [Propionibacteriaceae bacterium]
MSNLVAALTSARKKARAGRSRQAALGPSVMWALPAVVVYALFALIPILVVVVISFMDWDGVRPPKFVGLANWANLPNIAFLGGSVQIMLILLVCSILVQLPIGLLMGVWAAGPQRNRAVFCTIFFLPMVLSGVAISIVWRQIMDANFGIPGQFSAIFGGNGNVLGSMEGAIMVLLAIGAWGSAPFFGLIFQGAAKGIPQMLYDAAAIDGAGRFRRFFSITLPQLKATIVMAVIFMVVGGLTGFETIMIVTEGGPARKTLTTPLLMYYTAFRDYHLGTGSVIAVLLILAAGGIAVLFAKYSGFDKMESDLEGM